MDVKPVAWRVRMYGSRGYAEDEKLLGYLGEPVEPLYDKAALDAAVAAERERCALMIEAYPEWLGPQAKREIAAAIRKG